MASDPNRHRVMRTYIGERDLGIPYFRRCYKCHTPISRHSKSGMCRLCVHRYNPKPPQTTPCRAKAIRLYSLGITTAEIARSCGISKERVCQFLRPTGLISKIRQGKKKAKELQKRVDKFYHKAPRLQHKIMQRYAVVKLYKSGLSIDKIRKWFPGAQGILDKSRVAKRKAGKYGRIKSKMRPGQKLWWESIADGEWHCIQWDNKKGPGSAYKYATNHNFKFTRRQLSNGFYLVKFYRPPFIGEGI